MTEPNDEGPVYARLAHDAGERAPARRAPRWARPLGWAICVALAVMVVLAAVRVHPWG